MANSGQRRGEGVSKCLDNDFQTVKMSAEKSPCRNNIMLSNVENALFLLWEVKTDTKASCQGKDLKLSLFILFVCVCQLMRPDGPRGWWGGIKPVHYRVQRF